MLGKADATPMIAVKDLDRARKFYEDTLGLKTTDEHGGEVLDAEERRHHASASTAPSSPGPTRRPR